MNKKSLKEIKEAAEKRLEEYNESRKIKKIDSTEELVLDRNKKHKDRLGL